MHTMHLLSGVAMQPILELKTRPKQLLGSLPLVIALPDLYQKSFIVHTTENTCNNNTEHPVVSNFGLFSLHRKRSVKP